MKCVTGIITITLVLLSLLPGYGQQKGKKKNVPATRPDSVVIPPSQRTLFIPPKKNIFTTHVDLVVGASRTGRKENSGLGFAAAAKGLYMFTGALYFNMGVGITSLSSRSRTPIVPDPGPNKATIVSLPFGVGFTMGDDRAMIINNIDVFPVYYVDHPTALRTRTFTWGAGMDLGFHIRIRQRLHLGMMGKVQFFMPYDKDEPTSFPRYGFVGAGVVMRYD